jgi:hypothetical protein
VSILVYVEGGAQGSTKAACRLAFRSFFSKSIPTRAFRVIASGDRAKTFRDFRLALVQHPDDYVILLVDSEGPVALGPWQHLAAREGDRWTRPVGVVDDQAQLMVQVMEAWFLADRQALTDYYGQGFLANSLPGQQDVEQIPKDQILRVLKHATRQTTKKGEYHKTRHAFELLERIDPQQVRMASHHAEQLFTVLTREANV